LMKCSRTEGDFSGTPGFQHRRRPRLTRISHHVACCGPICRKSCAIRPRRCSAGFHPPAACGCGRLSQSFSAASTTFHRFLPRGPNKAGEWFVVAIISTALLFLRGSVRYFIALESPPESPPSAAEPVSATS
jgi:hypothetical protein